MATVVDPEEAEGYRPMEAPGGAHTESALLSFDVERSDGPARVPRRAWVVAGVGGVAVLLLVAIVAVLVHDGGGQDGSDPVDNSATLLLISFDGFRYDYLSKADTPNLDALVARGSKAESLQPIFPSKTFPNHYSIVTGLYAETHGIVSNHFYDPSLDETFSIYWSSAMDSHWWGGEPIWVTAEKQGVKSACYFWPGSEAEIDGVRPTYYEEFDDSVPLATRVQGVLDWLALDADERPGVITLYFSEADHAGHEFGPDSDEVVAAIEELDDTFGLLAEGLDAQGDGDINIMLVADHGMSAVTEERVVFIEDLVNVSQVVVYDKHPLLLIDPVAPLTHAELAAQLDSGAHVSAWLKADAPPEVRRWC